MQIAQRLHKRGDRLAGKSHYCATRSLGSVAADVVALNGLLVCVELLGLVENSLAVRLALAPPDLLLLELVPEQLLPLLVLKQLRLQLVDQLGVLLRDEGLAGEDRVFQLLGQV